MQMAVMKLHTTRLSTLILASGVAFIAIYILYYYMSTPNMLKDLRQIKRTRDKVKEDGTYLPFYGITLLSMCKKGQGLEKIEQFIRESPLSEFFSPLPHSSYHVTIYGIGTHRKGSKLKVQQDWLNLGNKEPGKYDWYPNHVMDPVIHETRVASQTHVPEDFTVWANRDSLTVGRTGLQIAYLDFGEVLPDVKVLRETCAQVIFGREDGMKFFHLTLGYVTKPMEPNRETEIYNELVKLKELVMELTKDGIVLHPPDVYWFKSMEEIVTKEDIQK